MFELSLNHRWEWGFATIDPDELRSGKKIVHLRSKEGSELGELSLKETGCRFCNEYVERYFEQIMSHETIHFAIYDLFKHEDPQKGESITRMLDYFDGFCLKAYGCTKIDPICFHPLLVL